MSYYAEYKQRKSDGIWDVLNRLVYILFVFVVFAGIICCFLPLIQTQKKLLRHRDELTAQVAAEKQLNDFLTRKEGWLQDPEYVETLARDRLDLMKPGEIVLRLDAAEAPAAAPAQKGQTRQH